MMTAKNSSSCPQCGVLSHRVHTVTMRHHLRFPHSGDKLDGIYFYCRDRECETAYFSGKKEQYPVAAMQSQPQITEGVICFCFGISEAKFNAYAQRGRSDDFFEKLDELAYDSECHCKIKNPAGRGCLKVFKALSV